MLGFDRIKIFYYIVDYFIIMWYSKEQDIKVIKLVIKSNIIIKF